MHLEFILPRKLGLGLREGWLSVLPPAGTLDGEDTERRALLSGAGAATEDP